MAIKSKAEQLNDLLKHLKSEATDIKASAVVSRDGLPLGSHLLADEEAERVSAMSAAVMGVGERVVDEFKNGDFQEVLIKGSDGYVLFVSIGEEAILTVQTEKEANIGLVRLYMQKTSKGLEKVLTGK